MAFCSNCGTQIEEGVNFCPKCGQNVGAAAPQQQVNQPQPQYVEEEEEVEEKKSFTYRMWHNKWSWIAAAIIVLIIGAIYGFNYWRASESREQFDNRIASGDSFFYNGDYSNADIIFAMDFHNMRNLMRISGNDPQNKLKMFIPDEIEDPWYTDNFDETWDDVLQGCTALLAALRRGVKNN